MVIAIGGLPQNPPLHAGDALVTSSWDIIADAVKPAENVLLYDDNGGHQGMSAAEIAADAGSKAELVSPERFFAPEMGGMSHAPYMRTFDEKDVRVTINTRRVSVRRDGNQLVATLASDFAEAGATSGASIRSSSNTARCRSTRSNSRIAGASIEAVTGSRWGHRRYPRSATILGARPLSFLCP